MLLGRSHNSMLQQTSSMRCVVWLPPYGQYAQDEGGVISILHAYYIARLNTHPRGGQMCHGSSYAGPSSWVTPPSMPEREDTPGLRRPRLRVKQIKKIHRSSTIAVAEAILSLRTCNASPNGGTSDLLFEHPRFFAEHRTIRHTLDCIRGKLLGKTRGG